jgi:hypothetical protein
MPVSAVICHAQDVYGDPNMRSGALPRMSVAMLSFFMGAIDTGYIFARTFPYAVLAWLLSLFLVFWNASNGVLGISLRPLRPLAPIAVRARALGTAILRKPPVPVTIPTVNPVQAVKRALYFEHGWGPIDRTVCVIDEILRTFGNGDASAVSATKFADSTKSIHTTDEDQDEDTTAEADGSEFTNIASSTQRTTDSYPESSDCCDAVGSTSTLHPPACVDAASAVRRLRDAIHKRHRFPMARAKLTDAMTSSIQEIIAQYTDADPNFAVDVYKCQYRSPACHILCNKVDRDKSRRCLRYTSFQLAWPRGRKSVDCFSGVGDPTATEPVRGFIVLLPATGEFEHDERILIGAELAAAHGYATISITSPFYSDRMPAGQQKQYIRTVSDMLLTGVGLSSEAAAIALAVLRCTADDVPLVFSGFSYGGAMSATSITTLCGVTPAAERALLRRVVAVPYVGASTPSVYVEGVLQHDVDWDAMTHATIEVFNRDNNKGVMPPRLVQQWLHNNDYLHGTIETANQKHVVSEAVKYVLHLLDTDRLVAAVAQGTGTEGSEGLIAGVHSFVTAHDGFVPRSLGEAMHEAIARLVRPDGFATLSVVAGGHLTAFVAKHHRLTTAIPEAINAAALRKDPLSRDSRSAAADDSVLG